jgi:predicted Fe-Mo cluster-binding NifX family protein
MIIAVPYLAGAVNGHFGRTEAFLIANAAGGEVVASAVHQVDGLQHDHQGLAGFLESHDVDVILAGGMGAPMQAALKAAGFNVYCGVSGPADLAVAAFLQGTIAHSEDTCGHHHGA